MPSLHPTRSLVAFWLKGGARPAFHGLRADMEHCDRIMYMAQAREAKSRVAGYARIADLVWRARFANRRYRARLILSGENEMQCTEPPRDAGAKCNGSRISREPLFS